MGASSHTSVEGNFTEQSPQSFIISGYKEDRRVKVGLAHQGKFIEQLSILESVPDADELLDKKSHILLGGESFSPFVGEREKKRTSRMLHYLLPQKLVGLAGHELGNLVALIGFLDLIQENDQLNNYFFDIGMAHVEASKNFLNLLTRDFDDRSLNPYTFQDLLLTMPGYLIDENKIIISGNLTFKSLEEVLSIRTLLHNAVKATHEGIKKFSVDLKEDKGERMFLITDNIGNKWSKANYDAIKEEVRAIEQNNSYKGPNRHGLSIISYLAARRGDTVNLVDGDANSERKSIEITFSSSQAA